MTENDAFTTKDGLRLRTRTWVPKGTPDGSVILIHGYGDHSGRYGDFAQALNAVSLGVYAYDQRGFGSSEGRRGYVDRFDDLLADLDLFVQHIQPHIAGKPVFMLGQSFGGLIVVRYAETRNPDFSGLVLCSPFLGFPENVPPALLTLGRYIAAIAPWMPVSKVEPKGFSRRPEVVEEAEKDPLSYHGSVLARTGVQMQKAVEASFEELDKLSHPLLIAHGDADSVVPVSGSRRLYDECHVDDKTLRVFEGGYHELWHDLEDDALKQAVCEWICKRL